MGPGVKEMEDEPCTTPETCAEQTSAARRIPAPQTHQAMRVLWRSIQTRTGCMLILKPRGVSMLSYAVNCDGLREQGGVGHGVAQKLAASLEGATVECFCPICEQMAHGTK